MRGMRDMMDIANVLSLFLRLLALMGLLVLIGEPLRLLFSKISGLFSELDVLETIVINLYLGGFVLYVVALIPLHLFNSLVLGGLSIGALVVVLLYHYYRNKLSKKTMELPVEKTVIISFILFLIILVINIVPTVPFIFGSVHDTSLYGLFAKVIIENQQVPETLQPYLPEGIIYPQGFFAILAYSHFMLGFSLGEAPFRITPLFQAFITLAAYFLGKSLSDKKLGLILSFIFAFVSRWPRLLAWGSNAFVYGFSLYFVCLAVFSKVNISSSNQPQDKLSKLLVVGLLLGYLGAVHLTLYLSAMLTVILVTLFMIYHNNISWSRAIKRVCVLLLVSLIPWSIFLSRFLRWFPYTGHNLGLPQDVSVSPPANFNIVFWLFISDAISPYLPLTFEIISLALISGAVFLYRRNENKLDNLSNILTVTLFSMLSATIFCISGGLSYLFPFIGLAIGDSAKYAIVLIVSIYLFIGIFCAWTLRLGKSKIQLMLSFKIKNTHKWKYSARVIILTWIIAYAPFVFCTFAFDTSYLTGQYEMFCVTSKSDLTMMHWMHDNLAKNANVLVNPYDSGGFIPVVSGHKITYPFTLSRNSRSYQQLIGLIDNKTLSETAYILMHCLGVSHIFVAPRAINGREGWDPLVFLSNPNFRLVKVFGDTFLFEVSYMDPNVVFQEKFDVDNITQMGWTYRSIGAGCGTIKVTSSIFGKMTGLMITSQRKICIENPYSSYALTLSHKIFTWSSSNVTLSFYLNATKGFHKDDGVAIAISELASNRSIYFATPGSIFTNFNSTVKLSGFQGFFSFNLSRLWNEAYNSTLPRAFILEVISYDSDGIENVAYISSITIACK